LIIIGFIIYFIFIFFADKLISYNFNIPDFEFLNPEYICPDGFNKDCINVYFELLKTSMPIFIITSLMVFSIVFEFIIFQYLLKEVGVAFSKQKFNSKENEFSSENWKKTIKRRFTSPNVFLIFIILTVLQVSLISIIYYLNNTQDFFFYFIEPRFAKSADASFWGGLFDIYLRVIDIVIVYILIVILLMIINIYISVRELASEQYKDIFWTNTINPDSLTGLNLINNLVLKSFFFYSICMSLTIFSDPILFTNASLSVYASVNTYTEGIGLQTISLFTYQNIFIMIIFFIGTVYTFKSLIAIKDLKNYKLTSEVDRINENYWINYERLIEISSRTDSNKIEADLSQLSIILKTLQEEKTRILSRNRGIYDLKTLGAVLSSLVLPILSSIFSEYIHNLINGILK